MQASLSLQFDEDVRLRAGDLILTAPGTPTSWVVATTNGAMQVGTSRRLAQGSEVQISLPVSVTGYQKRTITVTIPEGRVTNPDPNPDPNTK